MAAWCQGSHRVVTREKRAAWAVSLLIASPSPDHPSTGAALLLGASNHSRTMAALGEARPSCGLGWPSPRPERASVSTYLVGRCVFVVELDLGHLDAAAPLGLVPQTILKRAARVLLGDEEFYRFRVVKLGERIQAHRLEPYSATRGEARSRHPGFGCHAEAPRGRLWPPFSDRALNLKSGRITVA